MIMMLMMMLMLGGVFVCCVKDVDADTAAMCQPLDTDTFFTL